MVQESIFNKSVAIIGGGPAGCACAKFLNDFGIECTLFDKGNFLRTLLPTGGGRCNLAYAEYDFKQLAKNYPRGEKFLYSLFSRFSTQDTIELMNSIGIKTYIQEDLRVFPLSNSAKDVREKLLKSLTKTIFVKEKVESISKLDNGYKITTNKSSYAFDIVVVAIGGHAGMDLVNGFDIGTVEQCQSLVGLVTKEDFSQISGVSIKNVGVSFGKTKIFGDLLFTHKGVSGPVIYKLSSLRAKDDLPYTLRLKFVEDFPLQEMLDKNPHKEIKNLLGKMLPKSVVVYLLDKLQIDAETPCHKIDSKIRNKICSTLSNFEICVTGKVADGEVVTCGGIDLKSVNPKTLESKNYSNLYFCGEILDIDGFCGGFNLQNCWTTAFVVANSISQN